MNIINELLPHQWEYVEFALPRRYTILGDRMGKGKSASAIALSCNSEGMILVICPAILKYNWKEEFLKFTDLFHDEIEVLNTEKDLDRILKSNPKVVITNYERLPLVEALNPTMIIADESHYLKNIETKRTIRFHKLVRDKKPKFLSLLSGTSIKKQASEWYSALVLMDYGNIGGVKTIRDYKDIQKFTKMFCLMKLVKTPKGLKPKYYKCRNENILAKYLKDKYIRRPDDTSLPTLNYRTIMVNYKFEDSDLLDIFNGYKEKSDDHIMKVKSGSALAKAPFTAKYALSISEEVGPIVIYSAHIAPVYEIVRILRLKGKKAEAISGSVKVEDRQKIIQTFQKGELDFIVLTIQSSSMGVTLTRSNTLIFNDISYDEADNQQAEKRIHRIGQKKDCNIIKISGSYVDSLIMTNVAEKKEVLEKLL